MNTNENYNSLKLDSSCCNLKNKKIIITGASGFIGSSVKKLLERFGCKILTIGRNANEDFTIDLKNTKLLQIISNFSPHIVCHFASGTNIARANENKEKEYSDTIMGTKNLIHSFTKVQTKPEKIIYLSSQSVYGISEILPVSESALLNPVTVYGENKLRAEELIRGSNFNYIIFRISSVYGAQQNPHKSGVIAKFISRLRINQSPIVFNSFDFFSDFIYISDVANAIVLSLGIVPLNKSKIYNLGLGKPTTLKRILEILYKYFPGAPTPVLETNSQYIDSKGLYLDISKIQKELSWKCKYDIESGIKDMLQGLKIPEKI